MKVVLVYTVNATGACTPTAMATELGEAWDGFDKSVITSLYGCTVAGAVIAHTSTQASITITIDLSAAFLAAFPSVPPDTSPFAGMFTAQFRAAVVQPVVESAPSYEADLAISLDPTTGGAGSSTTATATVTATGAPTPTGTVQFKVAGVNVGTPQTLVGGTVSLLITNAMVSGGWLVGANDVTYIYSGDDNYEGGTSPTAVYTITT